MTPVEFFPIYLAGIAAVWVGLGIWYAIDWKEAGWWVGFAMPGCLAWPVLLPMGALFFGSLFATKWARKRFQSPR
ncbi:hypothetical protein ACGYLO_16715 [Sulfitobacter sp. 1A13353]|uniref:hypothetical protein n=1 Tax=Sulfitobacter sp. 1A13353 TaxID=3368568 RepID=UPI003745D1AD